MSQKGIPRSVLIEKWIKWEPIGNLANKYYIEPICDSIDGFIIILFDAKNGQSKVKIIFADSVDSFCRTDESFRLVIINELSKRYGADFYGDWTFFKVIDSRYIKWLSEQSYNIADDRSFIHFCFIAADSILDVITNYEPKVELL